MPGIQVDGNDVLAVYVAAKEAVDRARGGGGPSFIESVTYRMTMHTTADDPKKYRTEEEVAEWIKRDPILRFQKYLTDKGLLADEKVAALEDNVLAEIKAAEERWQRIVETSVDPLDMFEHSFAAMPPHLVLQREELRRELTAREDAGQSP
jgi:TPP-dependent pyruvate/acetoin dehydrogenase alpha subunit